MAIRIASCFLVALAGVVTSSCGTTLPVMDYRHAERDQFNAFVDKIAGHVRCEMRNAVAEEYSPSDPRRRVLRTWAAKIELTIRAMDRGQLNPDLSVANLASTFTATFGGRFQADATREMVMTYFVTFDELLKDPARIDCEKLPRAPEPITGDLGIRQTLEAAFMAWDGNRTLSEAIQGGPFDTITHRVSFAVQAAGSISPAWRLQVVSANTGGPFIDAMRTRTDQLLITMGPAVLGDRKIVILPSAALTESFNIERLKSVLVPR